MAWNLHITGTELGDDLNDVLQAFVADLERIGHKLTGAVLTTDEGPKPLETTPVEEPAQTVGGEPVVPVDTPPSLPDTPVA